MSDAPSLRLLVRNWLGRLSLHILHIDDAKLSVEHISVFGASSLQIVALGWLNKLTLSRMHELSVEHLSVSRAALLQIVVLNRSPGQVFSAGCVRLRLVVYILLGLYKKLNAKQISVPGAPSSMFRKRRDVSNLVQSATRIFRKTLIAIISRCFVGTGGLVLVLHALITEGLIRICDFSQH